LNAKSVVPVQNMIQIRRYLSKIKLMKLPISLII